MGAVLINLPEFITENSTKAAKDLGISRTEFIKQAIIHELDNLKKNTEERKIAKVFQEMKKSEKYLNESNEIIDSLSIILPEEKTTWWNKK
jgi:metal-responsive CopG/Arc/MetJ family transcriptional regulator|tara:strand:- start:305 stop:577 length:273 start_codon:yes stop_codon:yes gene_type:complete